MNSKILLYLPLLLLLNSCGLGGMDIDVYDDSKATQAFELKKGDVITVVIDEPTENFNINYSTSLYKCVNKHLSKSKLDISLLNPDEVYSETGKITQWQEKVTDPVIKNKLSELGLTYLIVVRPKFTKGEKYLEADGEILEVDYAVYIPVGAATIIRDHTASFHAHLLELETGNSMAEIYASATDSSHTGVAVFLIIPIPYHFVAVPTAKACSQFGEEAVEFLTSHYNFENN